MKAVLFADSRSFISISGLKKIELPQGNFFCKTKPNPVYVPERSLLSLASFTLKLSSTQVSPIHQKGCKNQLFSIANLMEKSKPVEKAVQSVAS